MAHRHKHHKAHGGKVQKEVNSKVEDEAESTQNRKHGGKVHKRKSGGRVPGYASGGRLDKRARGGGVGSDKHPFSSAHIGHSKG